MTFPPPSGPGHGAGAGLRPSKLPQAPATTNSPEEGSGSILPAPLRKEPSMSYQQQFHRWLHSDALSPGGESPVAGHCRRPQRGGGPVLRPAGVRHRRPAGVMGLGLRRMNVHVIRHATQAFAQVILAEGPAAAAQGWPSAMTAGFTPRTLPGRRRGDGRQRHPRAPFEAMRPTPELSFAVREYGCVAGLNVTASHNPRSTMVTRSIGPTGAQLPPARGGHRRPDGGPGCL